MKKLITTALISLFVSTSFAHEGHDHDSPKSLKAPKGGIIKSLEESYIEVVSKGKDLKIYIYDKEMKQKDPSTFKASATAEMPRTKKKESIPLQVKENTLEASYDAKGAHRYTLTVEVTDPAVGHKDSLQFTIEPKK